MFLSWTLIGMRGDTFISLSFLYQILSAEILPKEFESFLEMDFDISKVSTAKLIESYEICP